MKKQTLLTLLLTVLIGFSFGQSIPKGMNYQAVARDKDGQILAEKVIFLKISLLNEPGNTATTYYTEVKQVVTNKFGLFSHVIGSGSTLTGTWNTIPWSTQEIWMDVSMRMSLNESYVSLSSTKLLAVPYAYHAGTASALSGNYVPYVVPGSGNSGGNGTMAGGPVKASSWQVSGNLQTSIPTEYLGNGDSLDLLFKTNAIERLRILANGNVNLAKSLTIGVDLNVGRDATINRNLWVKANAIVDSALTVKRNVNLNTIGGATTAYGPLTVGNVSPTLLTGSLTVNRPTTLRFGLTVDSASATLLTGTLRVNNATDLFSSFSVNSKANSVMTGTLRVDSNVTFKQRLTLDNIALQSTSSSTGALVVAGGVGIGRNLNVAGDANFGGNTSFAGPVAITNATPSTNATTGALVVTGGTGIGSQLYVGGATFLQSTLGVTGATLLGNTLGVTGATSLDNTLVVSGATSLNNTLNVTGITTLGAKLNANAQVTINANPGGGDQSVYADYPLQVQGSAQGIAIKVNGSANRPLNSAGNNNYVSFWNENGVMWGRIEGETVNEMKSNNSDYIGEDRQYITDVVFGTVDLATGLFDIFGATSHVVGAAASITACVGLGACVTSPIPSLIASSVATDIAAGIQVLATAVALGTTSAFYQLWKSSKENGIGVTYESGSGDYAEYLLKADPIEKFNSGDIVGVKGGRISKNVSGAEKMMVISLKPIVLGNMPQTNNIHDYEKVAFLGQVPVKVFGKVNIGDYILPNGNNNGVGVAVAPADIKSKDIKNIVGIAWTASSEMMQLHYINVAVGLNVNDNQKVVDDLQAQVTDLKNQIAETNSKLDRILAGSKVADIDQASNEKDIAMAAAKLEVKNLSIVTPDASVIKYYEITREDIAKGFEVAEKFYKENEPNEHTKLILQRLHNDPAYKEVFIAKLQQKYKDNIVERMRIDSNGAVNQR